MVAETETEVHYREVPYDSLDWSDTLKATVYMVLNRADAAHFKSGEMYVVPDVFFADVLKYSPFPQELPLLSETDQCVLISYSLQAFAAYSRGQLVRWGPVSMGKQSTLTPTGLFHCNWKSRKTISTINPEWVMEWYINLDNMLGVSMHQYDLPGYPASHACVRLLNEDAIFLYTWTRSWELVNDFAIRNYGTPVVIFGAYDFSQYRPWFKAGVMQELTPEALDTVLHPFLPKIQEREIYDSLSIKESTY